MMQHSHHHRHWIAFGWVLFIGCASAPPAANPATPAAGSSDAAVAGFALTVTELDASLALFEGIFGATVVNRAEVQGAELEALTSQSGIEAQVAILTLGEERLVLIDYSTSGRPIPETTQSNDGIFQHFALVVSDMDGAHDMLPTDRTEPISVGGPQTIPESNEAAAGIRAFYFRDTDGHPLELIWYPSDKGDPRWHRTDGPPRWLGIDHSAISVSDGDASLAFYRSLGLEVAGTSFNEGIEQEHLSGVEGARVHITGLRGSAGPGVEFLRYESPGPGSPRPRPIQVDDVAHAETWILVSDLEAAVAAADAPMLSQRIAECGACRAANLGDHAALIVDPDGHVVRLVGP